MCVYWICTKSKSLMLLDSLLGWMLDSVVKTNLNISTFPQGTFSWWSVEKSLEDNVDLEKKKNIMWKRLIANGRLGQNLRKESIWVVDKNV